MIQKQKELALRDSVINICILFQITRVSELGLYLGVAEVASSPAKCQTVLVLRSEFSRQPRM